MTGSRRVAMVTVALVVVALASRADSTTFDCAGRTNGHYPNPSNCSTYYACVANRVYTMPCPTGLLYDSRADNCGYPDQVTCAVASVPTTQPPTTTPPTQPPSTTRANSFACSDKTPGVYADPQNCRRFIVCDAVGRGLWIFCPHKDLVFHPHHKMCVWSSQYSCTAPSHCQGRSDGIYKDPTNCFGFVACFQHTSYPANCPTGLLKFNGTQCVHESMYNCHDE